MAPPIFVTFLLGIVLIKIIFTKELKTIVNISGTFKATDEKSLIKDKSLLKNCIIILAGVIFFFVIQGSIGIEVSIIALGGAAILLIITRAHVEKVLQEVDWATLIFFAGLFVVVGILEEVALISLLAKVVLGITGGEPWITFHAVIWMSAIASAFIDTIPFTATMVPILETLNSSPSINFTFGNLNISPLWWALALGADLGGNGTMIGSSAGVVAVGISLKYGHKISFIGWLKIGSFYDFNCCPWVSYTHVNYITIFVIIIHNNMIAKLVLLNSMTVKVIANKYTFLHYNLGVNLLISDYKYNLKE